MTSLQTPFRILDVVIVTIFGSALLFLAYRFDQPMLFAAVGLAPIAGLFAWSQPFVVCALFVAFAHFRLTEAYPSLVALKPIMLLGAMAVGLVACKALLAQVRPGVDERTIKTLCLTSLLACVAIAVPYGIVRSSGSTSMDAIAIPLIMLSASGCAGIWLLLLSSASARPLPSNIRWFTAFFILICLTTIVSRVPGNSFEMWSNLTWKVAAMTLASAWLARRPQDLLNTSSIYIVSGLLIAAVVIYNKAYDISLVQGTRVSIGRIVSDDPAEVLAAQGVLSDPNDLALILMFPLAFTFARVVHRRNLFDAIVAATAGGTILLSIFHTQSRGAALGILMMIGVILFQRYRSIALGGVAIVAAAPLIMSAMSLVTRASGGFDEFSQGGLDESAQHRVDAWRTAVYMALSHPLTGVGLGNFPQMYYSYTDSWHNRSIATHSMWFQVLGELGFIGFGLFVAMIWTSFRLNAQTIRRFKEMQAPPIQCATALGLQAALAGTCASGTFLSQAYNWPVYIIVALIAALANQTHQPAANERASAGEADASPRLSTLR